MIYLARRYDNDKLVRFQIKNGLLANVEYLTSGQSVPEETPWIAPGFFDIQINGGLGIEFSSDDLTVEKVEKLCKHLRTEGVFRFCPTVTTNAPEAMIHACRMIVEAKRRSEDCRDLLVGIHLEGPFISRTDGSRGAHPLQYCREYDLDLFEELERAAEGLVRIVTLSPEYDGAESFIRALVKKNILVSLGHTNATPIQIARAVAAGARFSTHLSNGTSATLAKAGNYCFAQMIDDRLSAGLIADGFHITPMMLRILARTKGKERIVLVSDQASVAGLPPGDYSTGLCNLAILPNGKVALAGDAHLLAGAWFPVSRGVANIMTVANYSLQESIDLAVRNPARLLAVPEFSNGENDDFLAEGARADFLLFKVQPAELSSLGAADTEGFQPGALLLNSVIYRGKELLRQ